MARSWYYFSITGVPAGVALNLTIKRISILYSMVLLLGGLWVNVDSIGMQRNRIGRFIRLEEMVNGKESKKKL